MFQPGVFCSPPRLAALRRRYPVSQWKMRITVTSSSCARCSSGWTWRTCESRPTRVTMSSTAAVNWRRWASRTQTLTASPSGSQQECGRSTEKGHWIQRTVTPVLRFSFQSSRDLRSQEERVHGGTAEERRRNEANVCSESQGEGGWTQGSRERGTGPNAAVLVPGTPYQSIRDVLMSFFSLLSCMRNLTVWRSFTKTRKRSWRRSGSLSTTSSTCSNRKRLRRSSCKTKHSRQGAPPRSRGTRRGKSKYFSLPTAPPSHLF